MATKKINTRILLRYDEYTNWYNNNPKLLKGEVAIATIPENHTDPSTGAVTQIPAVVMKVGTGAETGSNYRDLPFVSAKAADVLAACKSESALTTFINNVIAGADMATNEKFTALSERVDTLEGDENTTGSVAKAIKDAIDVLDLANTYATQAYVGTLPEDTDATTVVDYITSVSTAAGDAVFELAEIVQGDVDALEKYVGTFTASEGVDTVVKYIDSEVNDVNALALSVSATVDKVLYGGDIIANVTAVEGLVETEEKLATLTENVGTVPADKTVVGMINAKVDSVTAGDKSITVAGTATAPTVAVKLDPASDNAIKLNENGLKVEIGAAPEYTIVKDANAGDYAAVYHLAKDGVNIEGSTINIPKDMVVKSGSVNAEGNIVLVLNDEANTEIVIDAKTLIEYVTSGSTADSQVIVTVSEDHKVTATIGAGKIGTTELADGSVTTAKIADANVTTAKIADKNVTTAKIADSAITATQIADYTITKDKLNEAFAEEIDNKVSSIMLNDGETALYMDDSTKDIYLGINVSAETGNTLVKKNDGLYVPTPAEVTFPTVADTAVNYQVVTEVDQTDGKIAVTRDYLSRIGVTNNYVDATDVGISITAGNTNSNITAAAMETIDLGNGVTPIVNIEVTDDINMSAGNVLVAASDTGAVTITTGSFSVSTTNGTLRDGTEGWTISDKRIIVEDDYILIDCGDASTNIE